MKQDISKIDPNFLIGSTFTDAGLTWISVHDKPIEIRGLAVHEGDTFHRIPEEIAARVSEGVHHLATHTAGGRVRFATDSQRVCFRCETLYTGFMSHMPLTGSTGFDIYADGAFLTAIRPGDANGGFFEGEVRLKGGKTRIEINLPLYNGIKCLYIGIETGKKLYAPRKYRIDRPVVYYGSSITQGGCTSRPGNAYQAHITRWLNCDHINLGFSGSARAGQVMADYIASLDMSAFVYDYDHNAVSAEQLWQTHEALFKTVRSAHPDIPIIIVTKPDYDLNPEENDRRAEAIYATYKNAVEAGDTNVYFIHGRQLFGKEDRDACTIDGTHPNDLGFYRMAKTIYPVLKKALKAAK